MVLPSPPPAAAEVSAASIFGMDVDTPMFIGVVCGVGAALVSLCCLLIRCCKRRYRRMPVTASTYNAHKNDAYAEAGPDTSPLFSST